MDASTARSERGELLWRPSPERIERANITAFMGAVEAEHGLDFEGDYEALWRWSVERLEDFWAIVWEYFGVIASAPYERVLASREMPGAHWFEGARLNYAENLLRERPAEQLAIQHASELRELSSLTWGELRAQVGEAAAGLRALGVGPGDRVVAYMPNIPETIVAFLASASIGAIWSSCSPDFGAGSVVDRFAQIEPKVLLTVDGYRYGGRDFDRGEVVERLLAEMPSVERTVVVPYLSPAPETGAYRDPLSWNELLALGSGAPLEFEQLPFDHPLWVLYSSGTTGLPKAIVQGHGGILLEQLKKLNLHLDAQAGDRVFWFTTTGWMMWNFLVGVLLTEASIVLYDGNPGHPDMEVLWQLAADAGITCFGTSAAYIAACMKAGAEPGAGRDLSALRSVGSTGSPLAPEGFQWVYDHVGEDTWLFSTSGGTDVCTAFVGGVPTLPVYRGELQARSLGCAVEAWDEDGEPVIDEVGELVITEPMPSMPIYFWGDEDGSRYRESYFEMFPGDLAPRRLDRDHLTRHGDHLRALRLDDQPRRDPHGDERDLPRRQLARGDHRRARRRRAAPGNRGLDAAVRRPARGRRARRRAAPGDRRAGPRAVLAAPRPRRRDRDRRGPADAQRQGARGTGEADPDGNSGRSGGLEGLARQPGGARAVRGDGHAARRGRRRGLSRRATPGGAPEPEPYRATTGRGAGTRAAAPLRAEAATPGRGGSCGCYAPTRAISAQRSPSPAARSRAFATISSTPSTTPPRISTRPATIVVSTIEPEAA